MNLFKIFRKPQLLEAVERSTDGVWDWQIQTGQLLLSPRWLESLGYAPGELPENSETWQRLLHPEDASRVEQAIKLHFSDPSLPYQVEVRLKTKAGDWQWVQSRGAVIARDAHGTPLRMLGTHTVISDRKSAEDKLSALMRVAPVGIFVLDRKGHCIEVNESWRALTGFSCEEARGLGWQRSLLPEDWEPIQADWKRAIQSGCSFYAEVRVLSQADSLRWVQLRTSCLMDADGRVSQYIGTWQDLTEQRRIQVQMAQTSKMAALGEMAGGLAHEINNPLAIIKGKAQIIQKVLSEAEEGNFSQGLTDLKRHVERIDATVDRISQIVKGLRIFARDSLSDSLQRVDLRSTVEETLAFCRERFRHGDVELRISLPEAPIEATCCSVQISQAVLNLLNNAFDAIQGLPERWVSIGLEEDEEIVRIRVTDSGQGIPKELRSKIMQPFFTTKGVGKGTGLGLSISREMIEKQGGRLELDESCPNTQFVIVLQKGSSGITRSREAA